SNNALENLVQNNTKTVYDEDGNPIDIVAIQNQAQNVNQNSNSRGSQRTAGFGVAGEAGYSNNSQLEEMLTLKPKRLKTGFIFDKNTVTLAQQAAPLQDIFNNIIITATLEYKSSQTPQVHTFQKLFEDDLPQNTAANIVMSERGIS